MSDSSILVEVVEEVAKLMRQGVQPELQVYLRRFPELASELQRILPLVGLVEQVGNIVVRPFEPASHEVEKSLPQRLGDFELIRQIGQGGMGVVFEARQISLNRLVALKVLTQKLGNRHQFRERFEREARAAAKLHHSNIVPVFGFGEESGITYYTMQLIRGISLDQLAGIIRRESILVGDQASTDATVIDSVRDTNSNHGKQYSSHINPSGELADIPTSVLSGLVSNTQRFRIVAEFGIAAAHALHYAHTLGVIHRDIKPANILIDHEGRLWIADFGLAKAAQDESLTEHNDLLGTLRYLSPERFRGIADARSDLYSLGLTLYEMVTLRPAFDATDRSQLLRQTALGLRPKLRQLNPQVPEPLSTIIEKSLALEPAERYASLDDFAADLQRFLEDKSILAKPDSAVKRFQRWCRHNPLVASLTAALLLTVFGLLVLQQVVMNQRDRFRQSLAESLVQQARFQRLTGQVGQRLDGLRNFAQASSLRKLTKEENSLLVAESIQSMLLPDLELHSRWPVGHESFSVDSVAISPDFKHYVALRDGAAEIRTVPDTSDSGTKLIQSLRLNMGRPVLIKFSPGGKWLIVLVESEHGQRTLQLFELSSPSPTPISAVLEVAQVADFAADIDSSDCQLAVGVEIDNQWQLHCYDLVSGHITCRTPLPDKPFNIRYEVSGFRVAMTVPQAHCVTIVDTSTCSLMKQIPLGEDIYAVAWHPNGKQLAIGLGFDVDVMSIDGSASSGQSLKGHTWMVHQLYFDRKGDFLVSHSLREGNSRVWDLRRHRQVLEVDGHIRGFTHASEPNQQLAFVDASHLSTYSLRSDDYFQTIATNDGSEANCWRTINHAQFPLLISGGSDGLTVWHAESGRLLARQGGRNIYTLCMDYETSCIITAGPDGFHEWPIQWNAISEQLSMDVPRPLQVVPKSKVGFGYYISDQGKRVVSLIDETSEVAKPISSRTKIDQLNVLRNAPYASVSPDGGWIAGSSFEQPGFTVWNANGSDEGIFVETKGITAQLFFSPNSQLLLVCGNDRFSMFNVNTLERLWELETQQVVEGVAAFSLDGRSAALYFGRGEIRIVDALSARELVSLDCRQEQLNVLNLHYLQDGNKLCMSCGPLGLRVWHLDRVEKWITRSGMTWPLIPISGQ